MLNNINLTLIAYSFTVAANDTFAHLVSCLIFFHCRVNFLCCRQKQIFLYKGVATQCGFMSLQFWWFNFFHSELFCNMWVCLRLITCTLKPPKWNFYWFWVNSEYYALFRKGDLIIRGAIRRRPVLTEQTANSFPGLGANWTISFEACERLISVGVSFLDVSCWVKIFWYCLSATETWIWKRKFLDLELETSWATWPGWQARN